MMNENQFEKLIDKVDTLTKAIAIFSVKDLEDRNQKIWLLHAMGFSNNDIAQIINTTKNFVAKTLSTMRVEKSKGKGVEKNE